MMVPISGLKETMDASQTSLGDLTDWATGPILEFKVYGEEGSWMHRHIPNGINVSVPGWMVLLGVAGAVLGAIAAMAAARTLKDFMAARRHVQQEQRAENAFARVLNAPAEVQEQLEEMRQENLAKEAFKDAMISWHQDYMAWVEAFREENDRDPTQEEAQAYVAENPIPKLGDYR